MRLAGHGFGIELLDGWEARLFRRAPYAEHETTEPVLHLANFPLTEVRGDFGAGVVEHMRSGDVFVVVFDHGRAAADQTMFAHDGMPRLTAADFGGRKLQRTIGGQVGCQRFFRADGRGLCLYVVVGGGSTLGAMLPEINAVIALIDVGGR